MENLVVRTILLSIFAYFLALFISRLMGRKVISQMTFFDFVIGVTIGSVTANTVLAPNGLFAGTTMLVTLASLTILMGIGYIKSVSMRKLFNSEPVVLIDKGQIVNQNMQKIRLSISDLMMMLRQKNFFNISDVGYALMETNGKLSVLAKAEKQPATVSDLNLYASYKGLTKDLIMDGSILEENLLSSNINRSDFVNQLRNYGVDDVKDVFYAGMDSTGNLYISKKQDTPESQGQYGID